MQHRGWLALDRRDTANGSVIRQREVGNPRASLSIRGNCSARASGHQSWRGSTESGLRVPEAGEEAH